MGNATDSGDKMIKRSGFMAILAGFLLGIQPLMAQVDSTQADSANIERITVLPKKIIELPSVNIIEKIAVPYEPCGIATDKIYWEIRKSYQLASLAELLAKHTTVFVKNYGPGSLSTPSLRGMGAGHTQVYWNRFPINSGLVGLSDLSLITGLIGQGASVRPGVGSMEWGSGGLGGGINMWNSPPFMGPRLYSELAEFQVAAGSFGSYAGSGKVNYRKRRMQGQTQALFRTSQNDFPFTNTALPGAPEQRLTSGEFTQVALTQLGSVELDNHRGTVTGMVWGQYSDRNLPPTMLTAPQGESQQDLTIRAFGRWDRKWDIGKNTKLLEVRAAHFLEEQGYQNETASIDSRFKLSTTHLQANFRRTFDKHLYFIDLGWNSSYAQGLSSGFDRAQNQYRNGGYARIQGGFGDRMRMDWWAMVRTELINADAIPVAPAVGLQMDLLRKQYNKFVLSSRFSGGRNYRYPGLNDLYWSPGGNPDLKPETAWTGDGALEVSGWIGKRKNIFALEAGGFATQVSNWIQWTPSTTAAYWEAQNVKSVFSRGLEGKFSYTRRFRTADMIRWRTRFAYTLSTNQETINPADQSLDKQLIYVPIFSGNSSLLFTLRGVQVRYTHSWVGERFTTTDNAESLPAYHTGDISAGYIFEMGKTELTLRAEALNLWDEQFQTIQWRPMPGRSYMGTVSIKIK